jgi:hypothetical protein
VSELAAAACLAVDGLRRRLGGVCAAPVPTTMQLPSCVRRFGVTTARYRTTPGTTQTLFSVPHRNPRP